MNIDTRPDFLEVARRALAKHYPDAIGGFIGGSVARGEGTPTSDIDIAVLFDETFEDIHRNTVIEEGWLIEFFVQNPQAQNYFFDKDRKRGMCVMPTIVAEGIIIPATSPQMALQRERAREIIAAGPPPLTEEEMDNHRYFLSAMADDLKDAADPGIAVAILALLCQELGNFYLRAGGHWSGFAKSLIVCLRRSDPECAARFEAAFASRNIEDVVNLVDQILAPHGGRLQDGFRSAAPPDWREYEA